MIASYHLNCYGLMKEIYINEVQLVVVAGDSAGSYTTIEVSASKMVGSAAPRVRPRAGVAVNTRLTLN